MSGKESFGCGRAYRSQWRATGRRISSQVAILGWESLIWDPRGLPSDGAWRVGGPVVPIEFSRVSNDCHLTLVKDSANGVPVVTQYVPSPRTSLDNAISDLRQRENTVTTRIGFVNLLNGTSRCQVDPNLVARIRDWSAEHGFEGIVWTDLPSNFDEEIGSPFSVEGATKYLVELPRSAAERARQYINNAPTEVDTPLRRSVQETGWLRPTP